MLVRLIALKMRYKPELVEPYPVLINPAFVIDVQPAGLHGWPADEIVRRFHGEGPLSCVTMCYGKGTVTHIVPRSVDSIAEALNPEATS
jgi:hypothetical protein